MIFQNHFFAVWPGARSYTQITLLDLRPDCVLGSYTHGRASENWEMVHGSNSGCLICGRMSSECLVESEDEEGEWVIDDVARCAVFDNPQQWLEALMGVAAGAPVLTMLRIRTEATAVTLDVYKSNPMWGRSNVPVERPPTPATRPAEPTKRLVVLEDAIDHHKRARGKHDPCLEID